MKKYEELLRNPMKVKPVSLRAARQKSSSTPPNVYRMNYNESPYGMPPLAKQLLIDSLGEANHYPDWFSLELKQNIADLYGVTLDNVATGSGSSSLIDATGEIFFNEGDEVILGDPSYEAFRDVTNDFGAVPVMVPLDETLHYDLDAMYAAITPRTKLIVICNPNNPTGTFVESAKIEAFIRKVPEHVIVLIDEAYLEYVTAPGTYSMIKLIKEGYDKPLIVFRTFSKIYGMAGLRAGYAITSPEMVDHYNKSSQSWNMGKLSQITAAQAIKEQDYIRDISAKNSAEREKLTAELTALGCRVYESQANFILFEPPVDRKLILDALAEADIQVGAPIGRIRVSIGTPEMDDKFLEVVKKVLSK